MVSIVVTCYNKEQYISDCVESINRNQTSLYYDILVVDDCSSDGSYDIARSLGCKVIRNKNNLQTPSTRNIGIANTKGEYIICLDADDKIPSNYIQSNYDNIVENEVDISYSNSQCFGELNRMFNWPEFDIEKIRRGPFIHCSAMFKRKVWETVGGFDESFINGSSDYDFWLNCAYNGFKFKKCNDTFLYYRIGTNLNSNKATINKEKNKQKLREKYPHFYLEN